MSANTSTVHGTVVQIDGKGIFLRGASGSGKSSIALRLLDDCAQAHGSGFLVADDQVILEPSNGKIIARTPVNLAGLIEMRGAGIVKLRHIEEAMIDLVVDLVPAAYFERYPDEEARFIIMHNVSLHRLTIMERNPDSAVVIRTWLRSASNGDVRL